jgi:hypothetical protein
LSSGGALVTEATPNGIRLIAIHFPADTTTR